MTIEFQNISALNVENIPGNVFIKQSSDDNCYIHTEIEYKDIEIYKEGDEVIIKGTSFNKGSNNIHIGSISSGTPLS